LQANAATRRFSANAPLALADLDLPTRGLCDNGAGGSTQADVPAGSFRAHCALDKSRRDFAAACFQSGVSFDVVYADGASGCLGNEPLTDVAQIDVAARSLDTHRAGYVSGSNVAPGGCCAQLAIEVAHGHVAAFGFHVQVESPGHVEFKVDGRPAPPVMFRRIFFAD
jgi:hypothetical protein